MTTRAHKVCNLCEAMCGLVLEVDGERVVSIRGDKDDPLSRGYICPKAFTLGETLADPDRLRHPLRRTRAGGFERVSWDSAMSEAAERIDAVLTTHGRDAVATYLGNPTVHNYGAVIYASALLEAIGTKNRFSASSVDQNPKHAAVHLLFGNILAIPVPDLDRTGHLLMLGANPHVSNGSLMSAPDVKRRLAAILSRGGKIVVVDPRRTETAKHASEHHFIRPGGDAALLAALVHVVLEEGLGRHGPATPRLRGDQGLRRSLASITPERVAPLVGIEAPVIRRMAREHAAAHAAACYGRIGTCLQDMGTLASWLVDALNIVTGNLDRPGGAMFGTPAADLLPLVKRIGLNGLGKRRSRVRSLPQFNGEFPSAALAEEIDTPGPGQVRGLVTLCGNPVLSTPNGARLDRALASIDFYVAIDFYLNETTRHAHLILPTTGTLEHDEYELTLRPLAVRDSARFSPPVIAPAPDTRHDWQVLSELALRIVERRGSLPARVGARIARRARLTPAPRTIVDALIRMGPYGDRYLPWREGLSLAKIERQPSGVDLGALKPRLEEILGPAGTIDLDPVSLREELARLAALLDRPAVEVRAEATAGASPAGASGANGARAAAGDARPLSLIGRRDLRTNNSWGHNARSLVKDGARCDLLMHPDDARSRGLVDGERVRVSSRVGAVETPLRISDEVMPGVVSLPHGWGHGRAGTRLGVAATVPGVSVNDVTDEMTVERITGTSVLNGVPVEVARAPAPAPPLAAAAAT